MKYRMSLIAILGCALIACASPGTGDQPINKDSAIVKGRSDFLKELFVPLGTKVNINIRSVDGKTTATTWRGYATQTEVSAGPHTMEVGCFGKHETVREFFNVATIKAEFTGGEVYQLVPTFDASGVCSVEMKKIEHGTAN